jgi:hypothetical protein
MIYGDIFHVHRLGGQASSQGRGGVSSDTDTPDPQADVARAKKDRRESTRYTNKDCVKKCAGAW